MIADMAAGPATEQTNVLRLISRLTAIIDGECNAIKSNPAADLSGFVEAKNRCLYELELAVRGQPDGLRDPAMRTAMGQLRQALAVNETVLQAHIIAVGDALGVVEELSGAVPHDGTYANPARGKPAAYL